MKKLMISLLILLSLSFFTVHAQNDSLANSIGIAPEVLKKLNSEQILDLVKEQERLKMEQQMAKDKLDQENETAMALKFGVNGQDFVKDLMPSEFTMIFSSVIFFAFLVMLVALPFYFNQRKSKARFELLTKLVDKDKEIPSELLMPEKKQRSDLHKSLILICIGVGVGLFLFLLKPEVKYWTIGLIPAIIGLGYFFSHMLDKKKESVQQ
jgi:predicted PurR-regulated permease PerM